MVWVSFLFKLNFFKNQIDKYYALWFFIYNFGTKVRSAILIHMNDSYLQDLNPEQQRAVLHINGPLLIVAGAGTGKTKTLTYRILHLINSGVSAEHILAITFTNKAASEMRERLHKLLGEYRTMPIMKTFHGLGVFILRTFYQEAKLRKEFVIMDTTDTTRLIKDCMEELSIDPKQYDPRTIKTIISNAKNAGKKPEAFETDVHSTATSHALNIWRLYEQKKQAEHALDFDDLLVKTKDLIQENTQVRILLQEKFKYIHIDEYQDTNEIQYQIAKLLAGTAHNICAVGDTDQNIYSWRGANIKNMLNFERDFPGTATILLEQNYRSTANILSVADAIITKNTTRIEKMLRTEKPAGEPVTLFIGLNESHEASLIAHEIKTLLSSGIPATEISVLYRTHFQSRALEEACLHAEIPYQVLGVKFFERKEIKDLVSYIRAAINPESLSDIKRVINEPKRGIGKVALAKIFAGQANELSGAASNGYRDFQNIINDIRKVAFDKIPSETVRYAIHRSGMFTVYSNGSADEQERLETMEELVTYALRYDDLEIGEGILRMLEDIALLSEQDNMRDDRPAVRLMTVHAAKGLEFDYVFVTGMEQGLFPHAGYDQKKGKEEQEEERRLFYVAVTRAREQLYLSHAYARTVYGQQNFNAPSEFLSDIPAELLNYADTGGVPDEPLKTVYLEW
jgi:DNA helicase-2/ATP-dependent DNA helicase PcrA